MGIYGVPECADDGSSGRIMRCRVRQRPRPHPPLRFLAKYPRLPPARTQGAAARWRWVHGLGSPPQELSPPPKDLLSFAAPSNGLSSSVYVDGEQRAKPLEKINPVRGLRWRLAHSWSKPSCIVVVPVSLHGVAAWRGGRQCTCEATINMYHANTPS